MYAHRARQFGVSDPEIDAFTIQAIFATLTNVNFDPARLVELIDQAVATRNAARDLYERASVGAGLVPTELWDRQRGFSLHPSKAYSRKESRFSCCRHRFLTEGKEVANLKELVLYGLKE